MTAPHFDGRQACAGMDVDVFFASGWPAAALAYCRTELP